LGRRVAAIDQAFLISSLLCAGSGRITFRGRDPSRRRHAFELDIRPIAFAFTL